MGATDIQMGGPSLTLRQWSWVFVVLFFVLGDVATTSVGLSLSGIGEQNELLQPIVASYGWVGMVGLKSVVVAGGYLVAQALPREQSVAVPLGLLLVGVTVTGWNLLVIGLA